MLSKYNDKQCDIIFTNFCSALRPERIHLRAKRTKRCRSCRQVLIKPEQKAISTRFKIKLMAM
jgi:hypothetical protein